MSPTTFIDLALSCREPNQAILEQDLRNLAKYLIKIGTNVDIALHQAKRHRLYKHNELNAALIEKLIKKYNLVWTPDCDKRNFDQPILSLYHIAHNYPSLFIETAAFLSPGNYEERRFWWCANNSEFYAKNSQEKLRIEYSPSRLLSDVICQVLTFEEPKLIAISALHMSVKHSEPQVFLAWFNRNRAIIYDKIKANQLGSKRPEYKSKLRKLYRIREAEMELKTVHVDCFIEWWNLTGLRR